jgi:hypothetical protein
VEGFCGEMLPPDCLLLPLCNKHSTLAAHSASARARQIVHNTAVLPSSTDHHKEIQLLQLVFLIKRTNNKSTLEKIQNLKRQQAASVTASNQIRIAHGRGVTMKAIGGPQKLRFSVASCSGEVRPGEGLIYTGVKEAGARAKEQQQ